MLGQVYEGYTAEDVEVWSILYRRQLGSLRGRVYSGFHEDLERLGLAPDRIPRFAELSRRLDEIAGWQVEAVGGFLPSREYLSMMAGRRLPAVARLRDKSELVHCKQPDLFHDVFGHAALLVRPTFRAYLEAFSRSALEHLGDERVLGHLGNFNKWVTEFGLIRENGSVKAFGAGLLSSSGELDHALGQVPRHLPADARTMIFTPHVSAEYQAQYFVLDSFDWLAGVVAEVQGVLGSPELPS